LKDRFSDVPPLAEHLIEKYNKINSKQVQGVSGEVMKRLLAYDWPGNIRELENVIERAVILCTGEHIIYDLLPAYLRDGKISKSSDGLAPLHTVIEAAEKNAMSKTLKHFKGNRNRTADFLEINRTTLYQKMKKYDLLDVNFKGTQGA